MTKEFKFLIDNEVHFECNLESLKCLAIKKDGHRCKNHCVIGTPLCWVHLLYQKNLRIKPSTVHEFGKGLFALNPKLPADTIMFRKGDTIAEYNGQRIDERTLIQRYGGYTAPYGVELKKNTYIDAACLRGVASLANHTNNQRLLNAKLVQVYTTLPQTIKLKATKNIRNNTEIWINYGRAYRFNKNAEHYTTT